MLKAGILGSTGRVGSLLIDDIMQDENITIGSVHVFDELKKSLPDDTVVTNDMETLLKNCDVVIDFSAPKATEELLTTVINKNIFVNLFKTSFLCIKCSKNQGNI